MYCPGVHQRVRSKSANITQTYLDPLAYTLQFKLPGYLDKSPVLIFTWLILFTQI